METPRREHSWNIDLSLRFADDFGFAREAVPAEVGIMRTLLLICTPRFRESIATEFRLWIPFGDLVIVWWAEEGKLWDIKRSATNAIDSAHFVSFILEKQDENGEKSGDTALHPSHMCGTHDK